MSNQPNPGVGTAHGLERRSVIFALATAGVAGPVAPLTQDGWRESLDPIGGFMIIFHTVLHAIIDVDYIVRRKTPPERMRSGH